MLIILEVYNIFYSAKKLTGYDVFAIDGQVGVLEDFLFDDEKWTIRYFVIGVGNWLDKRQVLLSPICLDMVDQNRAGLNVIADKQTIKDSPDVLSEPPISRQQEVKIHNHYGWSHYWAGNELWGPHPSPRALTSLGRGKMGDEEVDDKVFEEVRELQEKSQPTNLRSIKEIASQLTGYSISAQDGNFGHVDDVLIDEDTWTIRYFVIDTMKWWPSKHVIISPDWITDISWADRHVVIDLTQQDIKDGPVYDPDQTLSKPFEEEVHDAYKKKAYWE